jgi:DNA-binding response OmpR family regulator
MKKILIIEDDSDLCDVLCEAFEDEGYEVTHLQNGLSGKQELKNNPYDFLVLDIKIPGINGFDILAWLKETKKEINIIVLTGMPLNEKLTQFLNEDNSREAQLLQYASIVLNKPVKMDILIDALKKMDT